MAADIHINYLVTLLDGFAQIWLEKQTISRLFFGRFITFWISNSGEKQGERNTN